MADERAETVETLRSSHGDMEHPDTYPSGSSTIDIKRKAYNMRDSTREVAATFVASVRQGNAIMVLWNTFAYSGSWDTRDCAKAPQKDETK